MEVEVYYSVRDEGDEKDPGLMYQQPRRRREGERQAAGQRGSGLSKRKESHEPMIPGLVGWDRAAAQREARHKDRML